MNRIVTAFKEHKEFRENRHWDANILRFERDIVTPPHYADTVEMIVNHGAVGDMRIGGKPYRLDPDTAYYIPPNTVHSMNYSKSDGYITVLKINNVTLKKYLDPDVVLSDEGQSLHSLPCVIPDYEAACRLESLFADSDSLCEVLSAILNFFDMMIKGASSNRMMPDIRDNENLRRIIEWSEQNFMMHPTLAEAADVLGYNKNYFCRKFKEATGVTYVSYLQALRISHACAKLRSGYTISEVCEECGIENETYFIKLFRQKVGVTPKKYADMSESGES